MVAHTTINNGYCDSVVTTTTTKARPVTTAAMVPRASPAPAPARRNRVVKNGGSKEIRRRIRRCVKVRRKMEALRSLVPGSGEAAAAEVGGGGRRLDAEELLFRAADYIARLQVQVKVMQLMVDVLEHTKE